MYLLLIRHGESEADLLNVHEGRADFNLTPRGHRQAEAMAQYVSRRFQVNRIFASPLKRAAQTAAHLANATGITVAYDEDLMEFNNGLLAGLSHAEADAKYPKVPDLPPDQAMYGMESQCSFRQRAENALGRVMAYADTDEIIAVVSHGGTIDQMYRAMLKQPVMCSTFFGTGDTGIHIWKLHNGNIRVIRANYCGHTEGI